MDRIGASVTLRFTDVDVARALALAPRISHGLERLWIAGHLRNLMRVPEGEEVMRTFTDGHRAAIEQLVAAARDGRDRATVTVHSQRRTAAALVAFARRLYEMLADPETMAAVDAGTLDPEDLAFVEPMLVHAEAVVAQHG